MAKLFIGDRLYKKVSSDNSEDVRVVRFKGVNDVSLVTTTGKRFKLNRDQLAEDYVRLIPDGQLAFAIANTGQVNGKDTKDVIVSLYRTKDLDDGNNIPHVVCRQNIQDFFTTQINTNPYLQYAGLCMSQKSCPEGVEFQMILACNGIEHTTGISVYLDDTLDDILPLINVAKYDSLLLEMHDKVAHNVVGHCKSVKELLIDNEFMYEFRDAYDIVELKDFALSIMENGKIVPYQVNVIQEIIKCEMFEAWAIPYDRDIKFADIQSDYLMVSDMENKLYVVMYTKGDYINETYRSFKDQRDLIALVKSKKAGLE